MLTCREVAALVTDYLEGRLAVSDRLRFRLHVFGCSDCRAFIAQMKATVALTGRTPDVEAELPDHVRDELLGRFRSWKAKAT